MTIMDQEEGEVVDMGHVSLALKLVAKNNTVSIGAAFVNPAKRFIGVCEFMENETFNNLETLILQVAPKEVLIASETAPLELKKIKEILTMANVEYVPRKTKDFNTKDIEQDLQRLIGDLKGNLPELEKTIAMASVCALTKYLELLANESMHGTFVMSSFDLRKYMRLDAAAVAALNMFENPKDANKNMSLFGLLNHCRTRQGSRRLRQWLQQPLVDLTEIDKRHNLVEVFVEDSELRDTLRDILKKMPDLMLLAHKFQRGAGRGGLADAVTVYRATQELPMALSALRNYDGDHAALVHETYATPLATCVQELENFRNMCEQTINLDRTHLHEYFINPDYNPELRELETRLSSIQRKVNKIHEKVRDSLNLGKKVLIKLETSDQHGFCLRIGRKDEKLIRNQSKYTSLEARKDGVKFTTAELAELGKEYKETSKIYSAKQEEIVKEILDVCSSYVPVLEDLNDVTALLDVIISFASAAVNAPTPYIRPKMEAMGTGVISLVEARHPCLEVQDDVNFIPNSVELKKGESSFVIITGPNMGGKSTYIRQTGVITLLAQIGCFVPCTEATISVTDCILARVGAGDSQLRGVSTFMAEMLETASILRNATENSLIIVDELGRGTSTYDGFGLAWAISQHICEKVGSLCMFATHFHELTALEKTLPCVKNMHVTAFTPEVTNANEARRLVLLYKVKEGPCDRSFGIHVAELAHFPDEVVQAAKRKAAELEDFGNSSFDGESGEPAAKRQNRGEGVALARKFIADVAAVDKDAPDAKERLKALRDELDAAGNEYVRSILAT